MGGGHRETGQRERATRTKSKTEKIIVHSPETGGKVNRFTAVKCSNILRIQPWFEDFCMPAVWLSFSKVDLLARDVQRKGI